MVTLSLHLLFLPWSLIYKQSPLLWLLWREVRYSFQGFTHREYSCFRVMVSWKIFPFWQCVYGMYLILPITNITHSRIQSRLVGIRSGSSSEDDGWRKRWRRRIEEGKVSLSRKKHRLSQFHFLIVYDLVKYDFCKAWIINHHFKKDSDYVLRETLIDMKNIFVESVLMQSILYEEQLKDVRDNSILFKDEKRSKINFNFL